MQRRGGWKSGVVGGWLVTSARISLMEGRWWQPDRSWSRRDAAKACMAACVRETSQMQVRSGQVRSGQGRTIQVRSASTPR